MVGAPFAGRRSVSQELFSRAGRVFRLALSSQVASPLHYAPTIKPNDIHNFSKFTFIFYSTKSLMIIDHLLKTNGGQHMKILPWLTNTEDVIGTADELGKDCKKLDKLYDHCWQIAGHELIHENDNGCIYLCENAEGMLVPNPTSGKVEVYLKFVTKRHRYPTSMIAVKVGYLPKDSVFKDITRPTVVRLRCSDTHYDLLGRHFEVKIVIAPRKLSSEEYYKHAVEEDLS